MRKVICLVVSVVICLLVTHLVAYSAFHAGFSRAVETAIPSVCEDGIEIDFDGEIHLYD